MEGIARQDKAGGLVEPKCPPAQAMSRPRTRPTLEIAQAPRGLFGACVRIGIAVAPAARFASLTAAVALALAGAVRLNVSASAPIGFYRVANVSLERGGLVITCVPAPGAALARERGYLGRGTCPGGVQSVLKRLVGLPGDVVDVGPDAVTINGVRLPDSGTASLDALGRPLPHAPWGRRVLGTGEAWLLGVAASRSWDSRYFGPVSLDRVRTVRPVLTTMAGARGEGR
jgi:conjugative transfer signal peptidase TraF